MRLPKFTDGPFLLRLVFFHYPRRLVTVLVILESMFGRQPAHPDINARLRRIPLRIDPQNSRMARYLRIEQDHINVVMKFLRRRIARIIFPPVSQPRHLYHVNATQFAERGQTGRVRKI